MASLEELRYHPVARAEGLQRAMALPEGHLLELIRTQKRESRDATARLRADWDESWRYYLSSVDWSDKEDWQSTVWIPMPWSAVEQATAIIQRSMLDSPEFFGVEGVNARSRELASRVWKPIMRMALNKIGYLAKYADAVKVGFITGISAYQKFRWESSPLPLLTGWTQDPLTGQTRPAYELRRRGFLGVSNILPWHVFRDPQSVPREPWSGGYLIHEEEVTRPFLLNGAQSGLYRNVDRVVESTGSITSDLGGGSSPEARERRKQYTVQRNAFRKTYTANEWWGDILDENGELICPDALMLMLGEQLVYGPADNPLLAFDVRTGRRKWPFVAFAPLSHPSRFEGWGILRAVTPLAVLFNNLFNLFTDGLNWEVNPPTEVDLSILQDWDDLEHFPGKLWTKSGPAPALTPAQMGRMNIPAILTSLQFIDQQFQNESFVTSFVSGLPGYRSNITKGEVQIRTAQSMGIFDGMTRNLEAGGTDAIGLVYDYLHQYLSNWSDPSLVEIVGPQNAMLLETLPPERRMLELRGEFNYTFTGISAGIQKADQLARLLQLAQIAASGPYFGLTQPAQMLGAIVDTLGLRDKIEVSAMPPMLPGMPPGLVPGAPPGLAPPGVVPPTPQPRFRELAPSRPPAPSEMAQGTPPE